MSTAPITRPRPVPLPRTWGIRPVDVTALLVANGVFIVLMWVRHGGPDELGAPGGPFTATGQLMALLGTYLALIGIVLVGRSPWLDQAFGPDRLTRAHRWLGFATVWLIGGHLAFTLTGWAIGDGQSLVGELVNLVTGYPYVLWGVAGFLLFLLVGISSMAAARRRVSYETWYWLHVYTYLAVALAFLHQLFVGMDFTHDQLASLYWISLYALTVPASISSSASCPAVHGGGRIRTRSRRPPTAPGSASPSRRWATTPAGSATSRWAPGSSSRGPTGTSPAPAAFGPR
jgi:DMSO/TMAO reductase YedYZ heme-binding membrane subunit